MDIANDATFAHAIDEARHAILAANAQNDVNDQMRHYLPAMPTQPDTLERPSISLNISPLQRHAFLSATASRL